MDYFSSNNKDDAAAAAAARATAAQTYEDEGYDDDAAYDDDDADPYDDYEGENLFDDAALDDENNVDNNSITKFLFPDNEAKLGKEDDVAADYGDYIDDYGVEESSEDYLLSSSKDNVVYYEPELPQLDKTLSVPVQLPLTITAHETDQWLNDDDQENSVAMPLIIIVGAMVAITAALFVARRGRGSGAKKSSCKDSYSVASAPLVKRDLGV